MTPLDASLDTSFWNIAAQIGVVPYLFSFFRVHYCTAVEQEIVTTDPGETSLIYPQAMLLRLLQEDGRLYLMEPDKPLNLFGAGEAHAMAVARERSWTPMSGRCNLPRRQAFIVWPCPISVYCSIRSVG